MSEPPATENAQPPDSNAEAVAEANIRAEQAQDTAEQAQETAAEATETAAEATETAIAAGTVAAATAEETETVHSKLDKILASLNPETKKEKEPEIVTTTGETSDATERTEKPSGRQKLPGDNKRSGDNSGNKPSGNTAESGSRERRRRHKFGRRDLRAAGNISRT